MRPIILRCFFQLTVLLPALQANFCQTVRQPAQAGIACYPTCGGKIFCWYPESAINLCRRSPLQQYTARAKTCAVIQRRAKTFMRSARPQVGRKHLNMDSSQTVATGMAAARFTSLSKKKEPCNHCGCRVFLELLGGFEPPTSSLPRMRSTD